MSKQTKQVVCAAVDCGRPVNRATESHVVLETPSAERVYHARCWLVLGLATGERIRYEYREEPTNAPKGIPAPVCHDLPMAAMAANLLPFMWRCSVCGRRQEVSREDFEAFKRRQPGGVPVQPQADRVNKSKSTFLGDGRTYAERLAADQSLGHPEAFGGSDFPDGPPLSELKVRPGHGPASQIERRLAPSEDSAIALPDDARFVADEMKAGDLDNTKVQQCDHSNCHVIHFGRRGWLSVERCDDCGMCRRATVGGTKPWTNHTVEELGDPFKPDKPSAVVVFHEDGAPSALEERPGTAGYSDADYVRDRDQVHNLFTIWCKRLVPQWEVKTVWHRGDLPGEDRDRQNSSDSATLARVACDWRYLAAWVRWNTVMVPDQSPEGLELAVIHELCHAMVNELRMLHHCSPGGEEAIGHEERVVTEISRAMQVVHIEGYNAGKDDAESQEPVIDYQKLALSVKDAIAFNQLITIEIDGVIYQFPHLDSSGKPRVRLYWEGGATEIIAEALKSGGRDAEANQQ